MPYKCIHCSKTYEDGSKEILTGCLSCGRKFFFYIKKEKLKEANASIEEELDFDFDEKEKIESDVREITGIKDEEEPIFLDFESIKIVKPGKYLLDLQKLFESGKPKIYQIED